MAVLMSRIWAGDMCVQLSTPHHHGNNYTLVLKQMESSNSMQAPM